MRTSRFQNQNIEVERVSYQAEEHLTLCSLSSLNKKQMAWVFAGQGSQVLGMGKDLATVPLAQDRLRKAEKILGWSVLEVCDQEAKLLQTKYCQPTLFVITSILADLLKLKKIYPDYLAGYSLGEYIALYEAGVFDFATGLKLLKQRAEIMEQAPSGKMVAIIGCDRIDLEQLVLNIPNVEIINDDLSQYIISGSHTAVVAVISKIEAKKIIPLSVSKPFHTQLMRPAELAYQQILNLVPFNTATIPVLSNSDPIPTTNPLLLKERLCKHMTQKIRWRETSLLLHQKGVKKIVEISPSCVLTSQLKRTKFDFSLQNITSYTDISDY
jgi:[acyl-carrier-protein] S-malonyltransferase